MKILSKKIQFIFVLALTFMLSSVIFGSSLEAGHGIDVNGEFAWPVPGHNRVTVGFNDQVLTGVHSAIDIADAGIHGADVVASDDGTVIFAGIRGNYGNCIVIDHGDQISTVYAHMNDITVAVGDRVIRGQEIGTVGNSGAATGSHLHFEYRVNDVRRNPLEMF
ncbi:MAG: M23 family metallopeptidase [Clostridia bacterium]|nr:M23 family metallopeptidase [Clostridia bacterium]